MHPTASPTNALMKVMLSIVQNLHIQQTILLKLLDLEEGKTEFCDEFIMDVRNLLTVIRISVSILQNYPDQLTAEKRKYYFERIDAQATEMSRLVSELSQSNQKILDANPA